MGDRKYSTLGFAVSMTLFTVFALFLTLVLLTGASSFKNVSSAVEERFSERTVLLYVTQKIRMCDRTDGVRAEMIDGVSTLVLTDYFYIGDTFGTQGEAAIYIYEQNGYLTELYTFDGEMPNFRAGTPLLPIESAEFEKISPSLIRITISGRSTFMSLSSEASEVFA